MSVVNIDEKDLKNGVLGLVVALVEIIKETLRLEALRRMEGGSLTADEVERLGEALMDLDAVIDKIKMDLGVTESVKAVRDGLDRAVQDVVDTFLNPERWAGKAEKGVSRASEPRIRGATADRRHQ